jgi:hypothetical protein
MMPGDDNSGVVVGNWGPDPNYPSGPAWDALDNGYEVQIDATDDLDSTTGALYNIQAPDQQLRDEALNPPGEWNTFEITVDDPEIVVRLNGAMINHYVHDPGTYPNRDISATKLGIQNHGAGDTIFYRRVQVKLSDGGQANDPPEIAVRAPNVVKVKPRQKLAKLRFRVRNTGDAASGPVRLCVKAPKRKLRLKGRKCVSRPSIDPGQTTQRPVKLRVKPRARGKTTRVRLIARGPGIQNQKQTVRVRVRK